VRIITNGEPITNAGGIRRKHTYSVKKMRGWPFG
jgi:hypothetical protein